MSGWLSDTFESIRMFGVRRVLYWRLIYRHHMRFIHKRGMHQLKQRPLDGQWRCEWCGHMQRELPDNIDP